METLKRILITIIFIPVFYFLLINNLYNAVLFAGFIFFIALLAYYELNFLLKKAGFNTTISIFIALVFLYCAIFFNQYKYIGAIFILTLCFETLFWLLQKEVEFITSLKNIFAGIFILFYIGMMFGSLILLRQYKGGINFPLEEQKIFSGSLHIVMLLTGTWMCDIGAYIGGKLFGRTKLNLSISPNKTIEGFLSGIIFSIVGLFIATSLTGVHFSVFMLLIPFATIIGDLFESLIKRVANEKDSSHLIPGHGGVLDVFDALIFTGPLYYFCILPWITIGA